MNRARLWWRSLLYFRSTHLGVVAGVGLGAAVLTGALLVGDSVQATLRQQALQRVGRVGLALEAGERPFRAELASDLQAELAGALAAPALQFAGVASSGDGDRRALDVQLLGVEAHFFELGPTAATVPTPAADEVYLNHRLAAQLHAGPGDRIVVRVEPPAGMPKEAVLGGAIATTRALALRVGRIVDDAGFGGFALDIAPLPPQLALVSLPWLQAQLGLQGRANLILIGGGGPLAPAAAALRRRWTLADAGLTVRDLPGTEEVELDSDRVLLDARVVAAAARLPQPAMGVFTYLANELRAGDRRVPYALVTALGPASAASDPAPPWRQVLPGDTGDDEIVISAWLAEDLQAGVGDAVQLRYWRLGADRKLTEASCTLRVRAVVERRGLAADRELMPPFPGIATADSCREWQPGVPIDYRRIRDRDEQWWRDHGGTPKAFVTLATGQALWGDPRFGSLTALRLAKKQAPAFLAALRQALDPAELGLVVRDVRTPALRASTPATDFSGLFLGLSMFLIAAALLLAMLLLALGVLQRSAEIGALLALGFRPATVRQLLLAEAAALAAAGSILGAALAAAEARLLLAALDSIWADAVAGVELSLHVRLPILLAGGASTFAVALLAAWLVLRRQVRQPAVELLAQRAGVEVGDFSAGSRRRGAVLATGALLGAIAALLFGSVASAAQRPAAAFLAGAGVLVASLAGCHLRLRRRQALLAPTRLSLGSLARSNMARRPARSLAAMVLLASGAFLVVVVGANHRGPPSDPTARASGTGGFSLLGRSALPVIADRTQPATGFRFADDQPPGIDVVPLRVREGDEASCRNLNRPQQPRLLGVPPAALAARSAFAFHEVLTAAPTSPWLLLGAADADGAIPAIGDAASITWSLHRALGDVVDYTDEQGRSFGLRIVATLDGSILQGSLLIDEASFLQRFPSTTGYRMFLVDAAPAAAPAIATRLMHDLADLGLELVPTSQRLAELDAVQNTYLLVFQFLGGLGLVLGSAGLGVVLLRNVAERRSELALLLALGWRRRTVRWLLVQEHLLLLLAGAGCGVGGALVTALVQLRAAVFAPPVLLVATLIPAMLLCGWLLVWLAAGRATRHSRAADLGCG